MAKVKLSPMFKDARGKLGDLVIRHMPNGDVIASKSPDMSQVQWSEAQKTHRQRFKAAITYAKAAMANPEVRASYEKLAVEKDKRPFDLAVSDYFKGINRLLDQESQ
jgi:hypothetical protein